MIDTVQKNLLRLRTKPMLWTAIIMASMCFCFFVAKYSGDFGQWGLALLGIIILALSFRDTPLDWKVQVVVSISLAIPLEYFLSVYLGWYTYAWTTVPPWVYVGHGIVHFGALVLAAYIIQKKKAERWFIRAAILLTILYGLISFVVSNDVVGLVCTGLMLFVIGMKSNYQIFFACFSMFVVWLEAWGVFFSQWHWSPTILGLFGEANPPANIVAGYCFLAWMTIVVSEKIMVASRKQYYRLQVPEPAE